MLPRPNGLQQVYLAQTQMGQWGLFTGNCLAYGMNRWDNDKPSQQETQQAANRQMFELIERTTA